MLLVCSFASLGCLLSLFLFGASKMTELVILLFKCDVKSLMSFLLSYREASIRNTEDTYQYTCYKHGKCRAHFQEFVNFSGSPFESPETKTDLILLQK